VLPDRTLADPHFDFLVYGEGEETWRELLQALSSRDTRYERIAGLWWKQDGHIIPNGERPLIPDLDALPRTTIPFATPEAAEQAGGFHPYRRDPDTLARPWAIPGTPGLEHRVGGLTKEDVTGNVVYGPENHQRMINLRAEKIARIADEIPHVEVDGAESGELLVIGWGGTHGSITAAVEQSREEGIEVSQVHLRHLNPLPANLGTVLGRFRRILCPELNEGQLAMLLRSRYLANVQSYSKIAGQPFKVWEIRERIEAIMKEDF